MEELSFLSKLSTLRGLSAVINRLGNGLPRVYGEMTKSEYVYVRVFFLQNIKYRELNVFKKGRNRLLIFSC